MWQCVELSMHCSSSESTAANRSFLDLHHSGVEAAAVQIGVTLVSGKHVAATQSVLILFGCNVIFRVTKYTFHDVIACLTGYYLLVFYEV